MEYQSLRQHLQSGRLGYLDPVDLWECADPEPQDSPTDLSSARNVLGSLPRWARIVCALTAAEMVLPLWEESEYAESLLPVSFWKLSELTDEDLATEEMQRYFAPRRVIKTVWDLLDGEATEEEVREARALATTALGLAVVGTDAAYAAVYAASAHAADAVGLAASPDAVAAGYAADAMYYGYGMPREEFYRWWWCNCKRRLAIELEDAELEWWQ